MDIVCIPIISSIKRVVNKIVLCQSNYYLQQQMGEPNPKGGYPGTGDKADLGNHSNQLNPNHPEYAGGKKEYSGTGDKADLGNHSNQLNPNHPEYKGKK